MDLEVHASGIKIDDASRIIELCDPTVLGFDSNPAFWRGHGDARWSLTPKVFRRDPQRPYEGYDECALIGHFLMRAPTRSHARTPDPEDFFGWLFLAQHYGLPTRLLDWTENPLIALYFAVEGGYESDRDGCVWAASPNKLNKSFGNNGLARIRDPDVRGIAAPAFTGIPCEDVILAIDGREIDLRMLVQIGRFTLHGRGSAIDQIHDSAGWLRKYVVPQEHKKHIRHQLAALGIKRSNLFPDLTSLAAELSESRFGSLYW